MAAIRILLADNDPGRARLLERSLALDADVAIMLPASGELLADAVTREAPDVILVDMSRPDRDALEAMRQLTARQKRPIVLFVDDDDPGFMEEAIAAGVCSYNVLGVPPPDVKPILRAAIALFNRHARTEAELRAAETRLRERAVIDRAKTILIVERRLPEREAHRWLQKRAMEKGRRLVDVAEELIQARQGLS